MEVDGYTRAVITDHRLTAQCVNQSTCLFACMAHLSETARARHFFSPFCEQRWFSAAASPCERQLAS